MVIACFKHWLTIVTHSSPLTPIPCPWEEIRDQVSGLGSQAFRYFRLQHQAPRTDDSPGSQQLEEETAAGVSASCSGPTCPAFLTDAAGRRLVLSMGNIVNQTREPGYSIPKTHETAESLTEFPFSHFQIPGPFHLLLPNLLPLFNCLGFKVTILTAE